MGSDDNSHQIGYCTIQPTDEFYRGKGRVTLEFYCHYLVQGPIEIEFFF